VQENIRRQGTRNNITLVDQKIPVLHFSPKNFSILRKIKVNCLHICLEMPGHRCNSRELARPTTLGVTIWGTAYWEVLTFFF